jgi:hypothetical protein
MQQYYSHQCTRGAPVCGARGAGCHTCWHDEIKRV